MKFDFEDVAAASTVRVYGNTGAQGSVCISINTPGEKHELTLHYSELLALLRMLRTVMDLRREEAK